MSAKLDRCQDWAAVMERAYNADTWGQLEAADQYEKLIKSIAASVGSEDWTEPECVFLGKLAQCLKQRVDVLQSPVSKAEMFPKENVHKLIPPLRNLSFELDPKFPPELEKYTKADNNNGVSSATAPLAQYKPGKMLDNEGYAPGDDSGSEDEPEDESGGGGGGGTTNLIVAVSKPGSLLPPIETKKGETRLEIKIEKIGLKDAFAVKETYFTISVKDSTGLDVTPLQETPTCGVREGLYIHFNSTVHIQKPLEKLPKRYAIFFELWRTKNWVNDKLGLEVDMPSKLRTAGIYLKCWTMVEPDEVARSGPLVCQLYKRPVDFRRKMSKLKTITSKELYLHLRINRITN